MQPFLFVSCSVEGFLYLNGRFAGVLSGESLCVPASPTGAVYIEMRPTVLGYLPLARGFCLSRGSVVEASVPIERGMSVVAWPECAAEIALEPEPITGYADEHDERGIALDGATRQRITALGDVAGHALVETFAMRDGRWTLAESEIMWAERGPTWPQTAEDTALAAAQAAILGQFGEMAGYVAAGGVGAEQALRALNGRYDGCARQAFGPPRERLALVRVLSPNFASVDYAKYSCVRQSGRQGDWKVAEFEREVT